MVVLGVEAGGGPFADGLLRLPQGPLRVVVGQVHLGRDAGAEVGEGQEVALVLGRLELGGQADLQVPQAAQFLARQQGMELGQVQFEIQPGAVVLEQGLGLLQQLHRRLPPPLHERRGPCGHQGPAPGIGVAHPLGQVQGQVLAALGGPGPAVAPVGLVDGLLGQGPHDAERLPRPQGQEQVPGLEGAAPGRVHRAETHGRGPADVDPVQVRLGDLVFGARLETVAPEAQAQPGAQPHQPGPPGRQGQLHAHGLEHCRQGLLPVVEVAAAEVFLRGPPLQAQGVGRLGQGQGLEVHLGGLVAQPGARQGVAPVPGELPGTPAL